MKVIELNSEDFVKLVKEYDKCKEEREELKKAVKFLNEQIEEYNRKFAKKDK